MAYSTQRVTSDGTLVLLNISISYFDRDEISVLFDGIVDAYAWDWVGSTDKSISFPVAIPDGIEVQVRRTTDISEVRHRFSLGAAFTDDSMDEDFQQILHIAQEAREGSSLGELFQDLDFHGYKAINLVPGTAAGHAVEYSQLTTHDATIVGYRDQAAASAAAALVSENNAAVSEANSVANVPVAINAAASKSTPVDADRIGITDSAAAFILKHVTWGALRTALAAVVNNWVAPQRSALLTDNDLSLDLGAKQKFKCTPSAPGTLTFTNIADGQSGSVILVNSGGHAIAKHASIKASSTLFTTISAAGTYWLTYETDGTYVYLSGTGALT